MVEKTLGIMRPGDSGELHIAKLVRQALIVVRGLLAVSLGERLVRGADVDDGGVAALS